MFDQAKPLTKKQISYADTEASIIGKNGRFD